MREHSASACRHSGAAEALSGAENRRQNLSRVLGGPVVNDLHQHIGISRGQRIGKEIDKWAKVIKFSGVTAD